MNDLVISEVFGMTLQGEGRSVGRPAFFVRLGMCNLDCRWCDTPYTWDWTGKNGQAFSKDALMRLPAEDVVAMIPDDCPRVVITGGEPLLQKKQLTQLIEMLPRSTAVEIETNGTLSPDGLQPWVHFNVSPKLPNAGVAWQKAIKTDVLREFVEQDADFKFVVKTYSDVQFILELQRDCEIDPSHIWLMPEGRSSDKIREGVQYWFEICADNHWNLSPRLHVIAFDDKRGV